MNGYTIRDDGKVMELTALIENNSIAFDGKQAMDELMDAIGDARYVLLGEASHGTHEYYTKRTAISKRLIEEKGFSFIAVEGDWPDCYRLNRYVKNYPDAGDSARSVLESFRRWPTWMWANWEVVALAEWLSDYNKGKAANQKAGFYGLDVYSLWESLEAILQYLEKNDPKAQIKALKAWQCFQPYSDREGSGYAWATADPIVPVSCEQEVVDLLVEILQKSPQYDHDPEAAMNTEQNAFVAVNAERYYRAMIHSGSESWNIRDTHMADTLDRLMAYHGPNAKAIVWEHNTHIGDARATDMAYQKMVNLGQLVRERHNKDGVFCIGFGSYQGQVIAGRGWGANMRRMDVPAARLGSWEHLLHQASQQDRLLLMEGDLYRVLGEKVFGHRAIGVVYYPEQETGNYVPSLLPKRYDAFIFLDKTKALHPLHIQPEGSEMPETYPFGL